MLQVSGNTLQQVETFKYLCVAFTCYESRSPRRLVHGLVKLTQFCVNFIALWLQNGSFQTPQSCQFLNRSLFPSLPMVVNPKDYYLGCKHQRWDFCGVHGVTKGRTEVTLRPGQETSLVPPYLNLRYFRSTRTLLHWRKNLRHYCDFSAPPSDSAPGVLCPSRSAPGVTLRDKVCSCEIRRALKVEPLLIERTQLR